LLKKELGLSRGERDDPESGLSLKGCQIVAGGPERSADHRTTIESYQGLAYIIDARHKYLLKERTPVRRRSRKE